MKKICFISTIPSTLRTFVLKTAIYLHENTDWDISFICSEANIAGWDIAQKHLNVCIVPENGVHNCSCCSKCMRTLMPLEAMGKLDEFSEVFDLDVYRKNSHKNKVMIMASYKKEGFATDNVDFLISHGVQMPGKMEVFTYKTVHTMKIYGRRILGNKFYDGIKHIIQK